MGACVSLSCMCALVLFLLHSLSSIFPDQQSRNETLAAQKSPGSAVSSEPVADFANYPTKKVRERKESFSGNNPNKIDVFVAGSQLKINSEQWQVAAMQCGFSQSSHTKAVILHVSGNSISKAWHNNKKIQEKLNKTKLKPPASSATLLGVECCWDILALWAEKSPTNITASCRPQLPQLGTCEMQAEHEPPLRKTNQGEGLQAHGGL